MIINEKLTKELLSLQQLLDLIIKSNSLTTTQVEAFLKVFEKTRYNILSEIKLYNKTVEFEYEKIKTLDSKYSAELVDNILKIYIPEVMPSFKNLKTHTHKRILLNVAEVTKPFEHLFQNEVCIYVKLFDKISGWDVDNKFIKPIADALVFSKVITDDNIDKMSYYVTGEICENPHTEIYVFENKKINEILKNACT